MLISDDDGESWSQPQEITRSVKPEQAGASLSGPGIGIQLRRGPHKDRLVMPFYKFPRPYEVYAVYSDDLGRTWTYGDFAANPPVGEPNEDQMVELADGSIMVNARRMGEGQPYRKVGISRDGGATWQQLQDDPTLIGPGCQGSILRYSDPLDGHRNRILFANPAHEKKRFNGTVRLSYDQGRTWPISKPIPSEQWFCYCCLTALKDGRIGLLYETTTSDKQPLTVTFASFTLDWLTDGKDTDLSA